MRLLSLPNSANIKEPKSFICIVVFCYRVSAISRVTSRPWSLLFVARDTLWMEIGSSLAISKQWRFTSTKLVSKSTLIEHLFVLIVFLVLHPHTIFDLLLYFIVRFKNRTMQYRFWFLRSNLVRARNYGI